MASVPSTHVVFVDFENVPSVDLRLIQGKPVHVTLLIGMKQTRIDLTLVQQIHKLAAQVELVEVGASGRNALDLTLACYLGQAVERAPATHFYIVSRDKDFDAMMAHLQGKGIKVVRVESFAALPFLPKVKKAPATKAPVAVKASPPPKEAGTAKALIPLTAAESEGRFEKLIGRLTTIQSQRPKKRESLLAYINTVFGGKLNESEQAEKQAELVRRGVLSINDKDKVSYGGSKQ